MPEQHFDEMDQSLMKNLKSVVKTPVPKEVLKDFSASVIEKISEKEPPREIYKPVHSVAWLVPAFAVLILASAVVWRLPLGQSVAFKPTVAFQLASNVSAISEEVAALRELGAWTDDDDVSAGAAEEIA